MAKRIIITNGKKYIVTTPDYNDEETDAQVQAEIFSSLNPRGAGYCDSAGSGSLPSSQPIYVPFVVDQPDDFTSQTGSNIILTAIIAPYSSDLQDPRFWMNFQWYFDGVALVDDGHYTGSLTNTLTIYNMIVGNTGSYALSASNEWGNIVTTTSTLTLI